MRNLAFFLIGIMLALFLGIASAEAAWCTTIYASGGRNYVIQPAAQGTQAQLQACTTPIVLTSAEFSTLSGVTTVTPLSPSLAINDSVAFLGLGIAFLASIWGIRKLYDLYTLDQKS